MRAIQSERFTSRLQQAQRDNQSLLCVGLDPTPARFPSTLGNTPDQIISFNRAIIEATSDLVCCYKPNLGFYLPFGKVGIDALAQIRRDVPDHIPVMLDAKVGDIDSTTVAYAEAYFETLGFDAVTAHPYLGQDSLQPLLDYPDRSVFVLAKTSNPGAGLLQDRVLEAGDNLPTEPVSYTVARHAVEWNVNGNVGLVVGATYPADIEAIRAIAPDLPFLIPGVGAQAGDAVAAVRAGLDANGSGVIVNSARSICYASSGTDFQDAARRVALDTRAMIESARP